MENNKQNEKKGESKFGIAQLKAVKEVRRDPDAPANYFIVEYSDEYRAANKENKYADAKQMLLKRALDQQAYKRELNFSNKFKPESQHVLPPLENFIHVESDFGIEQTYYYTLTEYFPTLFERINKAKKEPIEESEIAGIALSLIKALAQVSVKNWHVLVKRTVFIHL